MRRGETALETCECVDDFPRLINLAAHATYVDRPKNAGVYETLHGFRYARQGAAELRRERRLLLVGVRQEIEA